MSEISSEDELLRILDARGDRDVYRTLDGWYYTYRGNDDRRVADGLIKNLVARGVLRPCYSNTNDCLHLGRTIDVEASKQARQQYGKKAALVYIN